MIYLAVFTDLLITAVLVISLLSIHKSRKQINEYKFRIHSLFLIVIIVTIVLTSASLFEAIYSYINSSRINPLLNAYVNAVMIGILCSYASCKSYICDAGVFSLGVFHKWNEIQSYSWSADKRYIVFQVKDNSIISKYKLKYRVDQKYIEEINEYLNFHLEKFNSI